MNERIFKVLEFDKIIQRLNQLTASSLGEEKTRRLKPLTDLNEVEKNHLETDEAVSVLRLKGHIPLGGIVDIKPMIKRAVIGGILNANECLDVAGTIYGGRQLKLFIEQMEEPELPIIREMIDAIVTLPELERMIKNAIDDHGHVMDGASDQLRSLRSRIRSNQSRIRDRMDNITKSKSKMLSDTIVTIRNDRFVLPVKQEYRMAIGGIVHDQSASGQTLFMEPQAVVELNNELQSLRVKEKQEVEKILRDLTIAIAEQEEQLSSNVEILGSVDFIFARGKLSEQMKARKPKMNDQGIIKMMQARHPLLNEDEVVANDIELGESYTSIVITGPNTGGKTVTLKMVGLCTLMAQSGLQIPAQDGCQLSLFNEVYADIGDEQSIEQSLSTFSSHMTNIVKILKEVDEKTLVLFDELGAGTDPQEGAALAMSILDYVVDKKARVIATTHYPELKAYGYNRENVVNASVEFDIQTLKPTYRLLIGVPGRSNAFEISRRLGLDEAVIAQAKMQVGTDSKDVENMIASLEASRRGADNDYVEAHQILEEAEYLRNELKDQLDKLDQKKEMVLKKAEEKAEKALAKAKEEAEQIVNELKSRKEDINFKDHEWIETKKLLEESQPKLTKKTPDKAETAPTPKTKELKVGDEVKLLSLDQKATILEKTGKNEFQIQVGIMKMKAKRKDLLFLNRTQDKIEQPLTTMRGQAYHVKPELDLRGERYEDALQQLEKYIDDAILANYTTVSIIHGKGTGALRQGVKTFARKHSRINAAKDGGMNEGGSGVTVLELK
ncbi:endonuclease MutS2 [Saliterribacillus persicus]|uniref:Endonuclease MutS2 n=1 Tax=Saliterribacillus persicus TaxID=930114 RepID=A0A368XEG3_9BACI|nr:endonuclease MutS2 [Saliterribacillus persicus]RCW66352.1 DNA mismatch repair protein MutS2 [Saliterribacillus persicus]